MPAVIRQLARVFPVILLVLGICSIGIFYTPQPPRPITHNGVPDTFPAKKSNRKQLFDGNWDYQRDRDNLMLTQDQCNQAFPDLYFEIDRARDDRKSRLISLKELDNIPARNGYIRAMIYDQQVCPVICSGNSPVDLTVLAICPRQTRLYLVPRASDPVSYKPSDCVIARTSAQHRIRVQHRRLCGWTSTMGICSPCQGQGDMANPRFWVLVMA